MDWLPPPKPAPSDGEDDGGDAQCPDEEVESYMPARMDRLAAAAEEHKEKVGGVID